MMNQEQFLKTVLDSVMSSGNFASTKAENKNMYGWSYPNGDADSDQNEDLKTLRAQSRDLARSSSIASGALTSTTVNTVGTGMKPMARIMQALIPSMTKEVAKSWQKMAENYFWIWADSKDCDWTNTQNFWQLQKLVFRSFLESGDCFVIRRFDEDKSRPFGLSLQVVEADRISSQNGKDTDKIISGVEKDEKGRVVKYHICNRNPDDTSKYVTKIWTTVPASEVLHVFDRTRPDQTRGVAFLAAAIEPLKQLNRFTEAELTAAVVTAMFAIFIKTDSKSNPIFPGSIPGAVNSANGTAVGGMPITPAGTTAVKIKSGAMVNLAPNESIEVADPKRPNQAFSPFFQAMVREIGVALNIPYEILLKHYESSYTAARASILDAEKTWKSFRLLFTSSFLNPVWGWFIEECIARNYLTANGFNLNPLIKRAYSFVQWTSPAMGSLNPSVEADAEYKWFSMGAKTMEQIAQENHGNDFDEVVDSQESERARLFALPVLANGSIVSTPIDPMEEPE